MHEKFVPAGLLGSNDQFVRVIDIATRDVAGLMATEPLGKAATIMAERQISSIVVLDAAGYPEGIVTEGNVLPAMRSGIPRETALRNIMSSPVICVPPGMACLDAYRLCLRESIRHLVIVDDDGALLGVMSECVRMQREPDDYRKRLDGGAAEASAGFSSLVDQSAEVNMRLLAGIFDTCQEAILVTNAENIIVAVNPAFTRITGYNREEVLGKNPKILSSGRQDKAFYSAMWRAIKTRMEWRGEVWNRRKSGEAYAELLSIAVIGDEAGRVLRHVGIFSDITTLKSHEAELNQIANYDALTSIPNRRLLTDRLQQAIARTQRSSTVLAVCYLDLDGFKRVNDRFGHEAGDQLLVDISYRLQAALRAEDTLARLGGDEFVILLGDLDDENDYFPILARILTIVAAPVIRDGREMAVSASIGVTFYPHDNEDGDTLLRHADQAMYVAKQTGKSRYQIYDPEHDQRLRRLYGYKLEIERGLNDGQFELYYQPKMELASGRILAVEALIRWHHPERGLLLPAEFLPVIENSELEIRLGAWVINAALAQLAIWQETAIDLGVSINISARHLQSDNFVSDLALALGRYPSVPRDKLQIEILETTALEDFDLSTATIQACRKLGVDFALDDFGTGYSSLAYLRRLPADTLKIDASFIRNLLADTGDQAIVQGVIALAKAFNRCTVAEGVEVPELIPILINIGCTHGQGYGIAYPMPVGELLLWLNEKI